MMATLLLSTGMPMILAGDEMGRTQQGNNNAYCQDSPISWVNWTQAEEWADQHDLTRTLLALRAAHPVLRPARFRSRRRSSATTGSAWAAPSRPGSTSTAAR
jgi:glycogen operon protein